MAGKISGVDLRRQAERDVKNVLAAHGPDLIRLRGALELGAQEAGAYWEYPNLDFAVIDACLKSAHVRQMAVRHATRAAEGKGTLEIKLTSLAGIHLYTPMPERRRIRTRSRPVTGRGRRPLRPDVFYADPLFDVEPAAQAEEEAAEPGVLFGHDPAADPYELSVLVDLDVVTKTLAAAYLAAIDWGPDDKGKIIYYEEEIPAPPMALGNPGADGPPVPPGSSGPADDGFGDLLSLSDQGEGTGTEPA